MNEGSASPALMLEKDGNSSTKYYLPLKGWLFQVDTSVPGTQWGTGGMATKLTAARLATAAGCHLVICQGSRPESIPAIMRGERIGTVFYPHLQALKCDAPSLPPASSLLSPRKLLDLFATFCHIAATLRVLHHSQQNTQLHAHQLQHC